MNMITGDLGATLTQSRRDFVWIDAGHTDGRDGTLFLNIAHAKRRGGTQVFTSRYSVGEVELVGWAGRAFIFDKEQGEDEHERKPGDRLPPYRVRTREFITEDGEVRIFATCQCMADSCKAPQCRHADATIELLEQGAFDQEALHDANSGVTLPNVTISERRHGNRRTEAPHEGQRNRERAPACGETRGHIQHRVAMAEGQNHDHYRHGCTHPPVAPKSKVIQTE